MRQSGIVQINGYNYPVTEGKLIRSYKKTEGKEAVIQKKLENSAIQYWTNDAPAEPCIVFLHSAFADHTAFEEQVAFFSNEYKVIVPDLIGHGASIGKGSITDTADHIVAMMEAEGVKKIHLVGVSIGAVLASDFSNQYPEKLASLCCIGGYDINDFDPVLQKDTGSQQMSMLLLGMFSIKKFAQKVKKISAYTPEAQEKLYAMILNFKKSSFRYLADVGKLIHKNKTAKRDHPLLIGVGEHDNEMAIEAVRQWAEHEPDAKFIVFHNAGHVVNMDIPEEFNKVLLSFVEEADRRHDTVS